MILGYFAILILLVLLYMILSDYKVQLFLKTNRIKKKLIEPLIIDIRGNYFSKGHYSYNHKSILPGEYKSYSIKHKSNFSESYNLVKFKTQFADMEIFFSLIKEGMKYTEVLNIRLFPYKKHIRSEGNVEKNYSRINIFTNNRYLTELLEKDKMYSSLNQLIRYNGDILLISHNNLHFKAFLDPKKLSKTRIMNMITVIHKISSNVYNKEHIEY